MRYSESPELTVTRCAGARTTGASMSAGAADTSTCGAGSGPNETVSRVSEGGSASATVTGSGPGSDDAFAGSGEEANAENSTAASGRGDGAGCSSGDASCPASDNAVGRSDARTDAAAEPGRSRSITVVSSAGAERMGATSRMTPPVATTSAEPTTPPMIGHRRTTNPGPR